MMMKKTSPCRRCTRVSDPGSCENKRCGIWQRWFLSRWAQIHAYWQRETANGFPGEGAR